MVVTDIKFESAIENVKHFTEVKKGKRKIDKVEFGFTCYANSVKVLEKYSKNELTVPTKAQQAKELLGSL